MAHENTAAGFLKYPLSFLKVEMVWVVLSRLNQKKQRSWILCIIRWLAGPQTLGHVHSSSLMLRLASHHPAVFRSFLLYP